VLRARRRTRSQGGTTPRCTYFGVLRTFLYPDNFFCGKYDIIDTAVSTRTDGRIQPNSRRWLCEAKHTSWLQPNDPIIFEEHNRYSGKKSGSTSDACYVDSDAAEDEEDPLSEVVERLDTGHSFKRAGEASKQPMYSGTNTGTGVSDTIKKSGSTSDACYVDSDADEDPPSEVIKSFKYAGEASPHQPMYSGTNSGTGVSDTGVYDVAENDPEGVLVLERATTNEVETVRIVVERAEVAQDYYSLYHQSKVELEASAKHVELLMLQVKELENQLLSKRKQPPFSSESQSQKETQKPRGSLGIDEILSDFCTSINDKCTTMKGTKRIINSLI
jgi:hypothetical protein